MEEEALTTAWFVELVYRWFPLMTSRYIGTAMSMFKPDAHDEAVAFLKEFMEIFAHVSIKKSNQRDQFKPVQAGVLISTTSALQIQHQLLSVYKFKFVLLWQADAGCLGKSVLLHSVEAPSAEGTRV
ncbi:hypothetical protein HPB48_012094 [Haemaphysalis longicornis]|uniref:Uncharacterized protein n=1 Tax=Haemaphysalis longicornis TaxID=44386 RepID=A0A9J6FBN2_HAELO|nr:hypothetical protein HPB48_012094 [Haemaphysalis longicornis]